MNIRAVVTLVAILAVGSSVAPSEASAAITTGCSPDRYCPTRSVTRGQMAAFLYRGLEE